MSGQAAPVNDFVVYVSEGRRKVEFRAAATTSEPKPIILAFLFARARVTINKLVISTASLLASASSLVFLGTAPYFGHEPPGLRLLRLLHLATMVAVL